MSSTSVDFNDEQIQAIDNLRKALHELTIISISLTHLTPLMTTTRLLGLS